MTFNSLAKLNRKETTEQGGVSGGTVTYRNVSVYIQNSTRQMSPRADELNANIAKRLEESTNMLSTQPNPVNEDHPCFSINVTDNSSDCLFLQNITSNRTGSADDNHDGSFYEAYRDAQLAIIVAYSLLCIVAVLGNSCTVYVVLAKRKMRNVTNYFIASLAFSDILMAVMCIPFNTTANVLLDYWPFGDALCPIITYLAVVIIFQNAYTLLAMSLERYIAIMHPFLQRLGKRRCLQIVAFCWILAFLTPIPTAVTSRTVPRNNSLTLNVTDYICVEQWPSEGQRFSYSLTIMILQYFVPLLVLIFTYAQIVRVIWLKDNMPTPGELLNPNEKEKEEMKAKEQPVDPRKKIIKMMLTVVGIYGVCWLPLHAITIAYDVNNNLFSHTPHMRVVWVAANWLAMSSCAYNPFIYWWMNPKFHEGYQSLFSKLRSCLCRHCDRNRDVQSERKGSELSSVGSRRFGNGSGNMYASTSKRTSSTQIIDLASFTVDANRTDNGREKVKGQPLSRISEAAESSSAIVGAASH